MNLKQSKKTLKPNEEIIKNLLEELIRLQVNLTRIKNATSQRKLVIDIINVLKNPKKNFTYQDLFDLLLFLLKIAKTKETKAIVSKIFLLVQNAYKNSQKMKS